MFTFIYATEIVWIPYPVSSAFGSDALYSLVNIDQFDYCAAHMLLQFFCTHIAFLELELEMYVILICFYEQSVNFAFSTGLPIFFFCREFKDM